MKDDVIDPSEILIDDEGTIREKPTISNPWIRFFARAFDYSLFFLLLYGLKKLFQGHVPFQRVETFIPFEFILWMPVEALFLWGLKTTPGKWWFRTQLRQGRVDRLDYSTAFRRSYRVWVRGLGLGIPVLNSLCMLVAYYRLTTIKTTSWDRDDHIKVTHLPISRARLIIGAIIGIGGLLFYYY